MNLFTCLQVVLRTYLRSQNIMRVCMHIQHDGRNTRIRIIQGRSLHLTRMDQQCGLRDAGD